MNMRTNIIRTYSELISIPSYLDRFNYVKLEGVVGRETFGYSRYLNQILYNSPEWKRFRRDMVLRDGGFDLAHEEYMIGGSIYLHHLNPITIQDVLDRNPMIFDPENVVCVSFDTHQAIHYSDESMLNLGFVERRPYDTCPWRQ